MESMESKRLSDNVLMLRANDFQALYLRSIVNRDKAGWAIVGYQLELLANYIFYDDAKVLQFRKIEEIIERLKFNNIKGPEKGQLGRVLRTVLEERFGHFEGLTAELFRKRIDRIIWELISFLTYDELEPAVQEFFDKM